MVARKCFNLIVAFLFLSLSAFPQELLPRQSVENHKYGYVDGKGNFVIAPAFEYATRFSGDYAVIREKGRFGYIDRSGKVVIEPVYYKTGGFSEGLFRVQQEENGPWFSLMKQEKRLLKKVSIMSAISMMARLSLPKRMMMAMSITAISANRET